MIKVIACAALAAASVPPLARIAWRRASYVPVEAEMIEPLPGWSLNGEWRFEYDGGEHVVRDGWPGGSPLGAREGRRGTAYVNPKDPGKALTPAWRWHVIWYGLFLYVGLLGLLLLLT